MLRPSTFAPGLLALATLLALGPPTAHAADEATPAAVTAAAPADAAPGDVAAHPEGAAPEQPDILEPQVPLAFWTLVVFLLLLLLLWRFAWGPLSKALHDREHHMEQTLRQAEAARAESERLLAEHRTLMQQANQQVQAMLDEARRGAEANAEAIRRAAQQEAEATLERARREIESARDQALIDIWGRTAELAVAVAGKVLDREMGPDDQRRLVEQAMAELPASPNGHGSTRGSFA